MKLSLTDCFKGSSLTSLRKCIGEREMRKMSPFIIPGVFRLDAYEECARGMFPNNNHNFLSNHLS